jgi:Spy/CpxP family protein refolding chaperone
MVIAILAALPFTAQARRGFGKVSPALIKQALRDAGLSDQQIRRIEQLKDEADRNMLDIRYQLQKARLDLKQLMKVDSPNEAAVYKQVEKISAIQLKQKKNRISMVLAIRKEVTPEQWEKLSYLFAKHKMKRRRQMRRQRARKVLDEPGFGGQ